jgi:hypothetical protein
MTTVIAYHEVDDRTHWLASPKRQELFGSRGITHRTFLDPQNPNRVAVLFEVPDMDAFQTLLRSDEAAEAEKHDGVRPDTIVALVES